MSFTADIFENTQVAFASRSDADLQKAKALFTLVGNPAFVNAGAAAANLALRLHLPVSAFFRFTVYDHFCGGETFDECKQTILQLQKSNVGVLLNYGVELKETEEDFDKTISHNLEAIRFAGKNKSVRALCIKITGFGRFALFEKIQAGEKLTKHEKAEYAAVEKRLVKLCEEASRHGVALYVDAEESWIQNPLDEMVEKMMAAYNKNTCIVANTFQLYRHDRLAYLQQQIKKACSQGYLLGAKLVRGAYMEKERERAQQMGYPSPIHATKQAVDADFDKAVKACLENLDYVYCCVASHSEPSNLAAMNLLEQMNIPRSTDRVLFSQLYGMGDNMTFNQSQEGFSATKYLPYGPVRDVIPYLIRRAQENTSVSGQTGRELSLILKEIARRKKS